MDNVFPTITKLIMDKEHMIDDLIGQSRVSLGYADKAYLNGHFRDQQKWIKRWKEIEKRIKEVRSSYQEQFNAEVWI